MDLGKGIKNAFLASVGAAATTAEVAKDIVGKMIEKGEQTVEQGKVLNEELKHNAKKKVKEHVSVKVTKKYDNAFECVDEMSPEDLELLKERIARAEELQKQKQEEEKQETEENEAEETEPADESDEPEDSEKAQSEEEVE